MRIPIGNKQNGPCQRGHVDPALHPTTLVWRIERCRNNITLKPMGSLRRVRQNHEILVRRYAKESANGCFALLSAAMPPEGGIIGMKRSSAPAKMQTSDFGR